MTASKKPKKRAPIALRWLAAVQDADVVHGTGFVAVAAVMVRYADSDGRNCYPAVDTVARKAHCSESTARRQIGNLLAEGLIEQTAKQAQHRPITYCLVLPDDSRGIADGTPEHVPGVSGVIPLIDSRGNARGVAGVASVTPDLSPPNVREEEESASAPLPTGRGAALPHDLFTTQPDDDVGQATDSFGAPLDLFSDQASAGAVATITDDVRAICAEIAKRAGVTIDTRQVGPALLEAKVRTGWHDVALAVNAIELLQQKQQSSEPPNWPSSVLAVHFKYLHSEFVQSPRMDAAVLLAKLADTTARLERAGRYYGQKMPGDAVKAALDAAELYDDDVEIPEVWDIKAKHLVTVVDLVRAALDRFEDDLPRASTT